MTNRKVLACMTVLAILALAAPAWSQLGGGRGGTIRVNGGPRSGLFVPGLPMIGHRPYINYRMRVNLPGLYRIDCVSSNPGTFDPYLRLFLHGRQIAANDNGAGNRNARIRHILAPGTYTVRVTTLRQGQIPIPTPFTLRATSQTTPGGIPTPAIPEGIPIPVDIIPQL